MEGGGGLTAGWGGGVVCVQLGSVAWCRAGGGRVIGKTERGIGRWMVDRDYLVSYLSSFFLHCHLVPSSRPGCVELSNYRRDLSELK